MTFNTPDIRSFRRGIVARFLGGSTSLMGVRRSLFSGAALEWSRFDGRSYRIETDFTREGASDAEGQPTAIRVVHEPYLSPLGGWPKRGLDLMVASAAIVLALPLMLVVAFLIKVITGGPVLFSHRRIGFNGKPFECYKFRTMVENADELLGEYLACDTRAAEEWRETQKLQRDPRVTKLGQILRKSSLDELPQLINILRGEMSCVGPRPIVADELSRYGSAADEYLKTRPGLTGLWQISGRNDVDYARRVVLDAQYVRNWSIWTDLVILTWTAFAVMRFDQSS
ncbi:sugar transferase [Sinorhizobium sp. BJ1]|uniref:sugar transferase n=1 Tax=Sinorhizobium sp. BJ1 TaxID=2035455 RepID=UPI001FE20577|nr:sugar transferase [Sinorhizobium sp. BJ1]